MGISQDQNQNGESTYFAKGKSLKPTQVQGVMLRRIPSLRLVEGVKLEKMVKKVKSRKSTLWLP